MKVGILVFEGFDELDVIGPYEVLDNARLYGADVETRLVTLEPTDEVTGDRGVRLRPQGVLSEELDLIIVPGGGWNDRKERDLWGEVQRGKLPATIVRLHEQGTKVASVCTGVMLLAATGLTKGRPATTHHAARRELGEHGADVIEELVVDAGDVLTSGSSIAGVDLALWLVEREFGPELARKVEEEMEYERRGSVFRSGAPPKP